MQQIMVMRREYILLPISSMTLSTKKEYAYLAIRILPCNKLHPNWMTRAKASVLSNETPTGKFNNEQLTTVFEALI